MTLTVIAMRWLACVALLLVACGDEEKRPLPASTEELGQALFEDPTLSEPPGQACVDCHHAAAAFADPEDDRTSRGVLRDRVGLRNAQSAMYSAFTPPLKRDANGRMTGGLFWDGRAATLEEQAGIPLLNPLEMNNPDKATVVKKVRAQHGAAMKKLFGADVFANTDTAYARITEAMAAFQRTRAFAPFNSKYDRFLAGTAQLDEREQRGLAIFEDPARGNCASCHPSRPSADGKPPLFTDFGYANLGVPRFNDNPYYSMPAPLNPDGPDAVDRGLGKITGDPAHDGMFRTPSLRNVARTTPYGHNGYFRRLPEFIEFMHAPGSLQPEVPHTVKRPAIGALTKRDIVDLVAFLETLTDVDVLNAPPPPPE